MRGAEFYSPSRRYVVVDASDLMADEALSSTIVDVASATALASLTPGTQPIGWYDENAVVVLPPDGSGSPHLDVVEVSSGKVLKSVVLADRPPRGLQVATSAALTGTATSLGF